MSELAKKLEELEGRAAGRDKAAKARLAKIQKLLFPGKAGRKPGAKPSFTRQDGDGYENEFRSKYGPALHKEHADGSDKLLGAALVHQLWLNRNPQPEWPSVRTHAELTGAPAQEIAQRWRSRAMGEGVPEWFSEPLLSAVDTRDAAFFDDAAKMLRKIEASGVITPEEPQPAAFLIYTNVEREKNPARKFTMEELRNIAWGRDEFGPLRPTDNTLERWISKFKIPMVIGRPPRKPRI